jgi:small subunit ribosomal protein S6e
MSYKINISHKGKTIKKEIENESFIGKKIGEAIEGKEIAPELSGYELEITGTSDKAGFPGKKDVEGPELKRVLLTRGFGMKTRPKGLSKTKKPLPDGFRLKKSVRGNTISLATIQINMMVKKEGSKKFEELLPKKEEKKEEKKAEVPKL